MDIKRTVVPPSEPEVKYTLELSDTEMWTLARALNSLYVYSIAEYNTEEFNVLTGLIHAGLRGRLRIVDRVFAGAKLNVAAES